MEKEAGWTLPDDFCLPREEEKVLELWDRIDAFNQQKERNKGRPEFSFYDGPPFATGMPHYGHITAGTIKDVVCRWASQTGRLVQPRFGWDCHGLPIENLIEKKLGLKGRKDILEYGVRRYNDECRSVVQLYSQEWRHVVRRFGRWVDFDNDYRTMHLSFMESVWWVFKQLFEKGLVYRGKRIMPYCNACSTVLSNFELSLNYKDTEDPSVYVQFKSVKQPDTFFLAWTTTPWSLPANLALAINPGFMYVRIRDKRKSLCLILAECRLKAVFGDESQFEVLERYEAKDLIGSPYVPLFPYFKDKANDACFRLIPGAYVTADVGTGVVHTSPGFGTDDYKACLHHKLINADDPPVPIDAEGRFTKEAPDFEGIEVKAADKAICEWLDSRQLLYRNERLRHSYPFCWRSDTPLIYKAVSAWFVEVSSFRDRLVTNNRKAHWVPQVIRDGKFHNWLDNAEDWCFSRSRFWGNPIPLWVSEDGEEVVCVGSIEELQSLTGAGKIGDLHREFIDGLTIPSRRGKGELHRVDEVFDCWFESGSMPFAQVHYPFSMGPEAFSRIFPADFIGEGIDQTRGWFYTLNVISTALADSPPYRNLVVNGLVMNEQGKKMSKKERNYPDPLKLAGEHGADAIRLYLINSPVVKGENLNFSGLGVKGIVKDVLLPWINSTRFLLAHLPHEAGAFQFDSSAMHRSTLPLDRWVLSTLQNLVGFVRQQMAEYKLYTVVPQLIRFLNSLTNCYVRLNRSTFRGENGAETKSTSLHVLFGVLLSMATLMAPFTPFLAESMYQVLRCRIPPGPFLEQSIHFLPIPEPVAALIDAPLEKSAEKMLAIIEAARCLREKSRLNVKQPVMALRLVSGAASFRDELAPFLALIRQEVNVESILFENEVRKYTQLQATPNHRELGRKVGKRYDSKFIQAVQGLDQAEIEVLRQHGTVDVLGFEVSDSDVTLTQRLRRENLKEFELIGDTPDCVVLLDTRLDEALRAKGYAREFVNRVQRLKKSCRVKSEDDVIIYFEVGPEIGRSLEIHHEYVASVVRRPLLPKRLLQGDVLGSSQEMFEGIHQLDVFLARNRVFFDHEALAADFGLHPEAFGHLADLPKVRGLVQDGLLRVDMGERVCTLQEGIHFHLGMAGLAGRRPR